jgi:pimeloyl-ACP methyl ester carboxylesterase
MTAICVQRNEIVVARRTLEVERIVAGSDRSPIVLLHEGLGSIDMWRDFPTRLATATGRDVVLYSRYGHGRSERLHEPRDVAYMHDEALIGLRRVLAALGITRPVLFGHSDGASIALIYAATFPSDVEALVLEAPHVFVEALTIQSIARIKEQAVNGDLLEKLARYHDDASATFWGWNDIWLDPDFLAWNIAALLPAIEQPILLLQGRDDEYGSVDQLTTISDVVPRSVTVLLNACGHSPHRTREEAVLQQTRAFLEHIR